MNKRFKDVHEPSVSYSPLMHCGKQELKNIKVTVRRKDVRERNHSGPLQRDLDNPDVLVVHRQGKAEGCVIRNLAWLKILIRHLGNEHKHKKENILKNRIAKFKSDCIRQKIGKVCREGQRPIFSREDIVVNQEFETRVVVTSPARPGTSRRLRSRSEEARSKGRYKSKSPPRYRSSPDRRCSYSKDRRRSRSLTPPGNRYKNNKDVMKIVTSENNRSPSPYSRRNFPSKEDNVKDYGNSGKYGKVSAKETKRSTTPEECSKYYKYKSPPRRSSRSPHRIDKYRGPTTSEKYRKRSPSPHGRDVDYKHRNDSEKYLRRSRSRGRSPYGPERCRSSTKFDRKSRSPHADSRYREYRKHSRSPCTHEGYRGSPKRYSRSPPRRDSGYRGPDRPRSRIPSSYGESRRSEVRMRYQHIPPTIGPPGVNFIRAPWFAPMYGAWRDPSRPELIPPHVIKPPPPEFYADPFSLFGGSRPQRPPIIYNNRNTKFPQIKKSTPSTVTSSLTTTTNAACSVASVDEVNDDKKVQMVDADESKVLKTQANSSDATDSIPIEK